MLRAIGRSTESSAASTSEQARPARRRHGPQGPLSSALAMRVGKPHDAYEREADAVADQIVGPHSDPSAPSARLRTGHEDDLPVSPALSREITSAKGGGSRMDPDTLSFMQDGLGADLDHVKIHTDGAAERMSHALGARAFAAGQDIYFGSGRYSPGSESGRRLLAHELTHTLQQRHAPAIQRAPIPGWNFTPKDYATLTAAGSKLTVAGDSSWFPAKLQENLLKTLDFLLGSKAAAPPTEGINALDFFHGHLVVKKDSATGKQVTAAAATSTKFDEEFDKARKGAIGDVSFGKGTKMTEKQIPDYKKAIDTVIPSFTKLLDEVIKIPGAAVMYHTFEFLNPSDLTAKGQKLSNEDPRRHYVTPLDTNTPVQYTPPKGGTYEKEYTHLAKFAFLVDAKGAVHVKPFGTATGYTSLELSTITGKTYPEPLNIDR